jgi:hypothetical protein
MNKILLHARSTEKRHTEYRNWPLSCWIAYVRAMKDAEFYSIGSMDGALHVPGTTDARGMPIDKLIELMRTSALIVGPSYVPMHLASLCGLPHLVWTDSKFQGTIGGTNRDRYETAWNPFGTKAVVVDNYEWQPPIEEIIKKTSLALRGERVKPGRKTVIDYEFPAMAMVTYERPNVFRETIESLEKSGIDCKKVYIYDDSSKELLKQSYLRHARRKGYNIYANSRRLGVFWNTMIAVDCLYNFSDNKILIYSQDDVRFSSNWYVRTRETIAEIQSAGVDWGILILWNLKWPTDKSYEILPSGHGGGVCWAINRQMWRQFREENNIYAEPLKNRLADYQICHWCRNNGRREWAVCYVGKSLVQHTGDVSTITTSRDMSQFKGINYVG